jgi:hypothetical protein
VGNDNHGTKVIVVPFDGIGFDGGSPILANGVRPGDSRSISIIAQGPTMATKKTFIIPEDAADVTCNFLKRGVYVF